VCWGRQDLIEAVEDCGFEAEEAAAASTEESKIMFSIPTLRNRQDAEHIQAKLLKLSVPPPPIVCLPAPPALYVVILSTA
jgi:hypothetical protein